MTFNDWWTAYASRLKGLSTQQIARDAWYAAISQSIHQQQIDHDSRAAIEFERKADYGQGRESTS